MAQDSTAQSHSHEVISFLIGPQEFCIDVMGVREIRGWTSSTVLPHAPTYVLGVINLRGTVLPIIDLGARLGLAPAEPSPAHVIVVAQILGRPVGLLVNAVCDILVVTEGMIQRPPQVGGGSSDLVIGIMPMDGRMITELSLDHILPADLQLAA